MGKKKKDKEGEEKKLDMYSNFKSESKIRVNLIEIRDQEYFRMGARHTLHNIYECQGNLGTRMHWSRPCIQRHKHSGP